ncbi:MAG: hypothetical protein ACLSHJ_01925 [Oscillospiraceae bacterium]
MVLLYAASTALSLALTLAMGLSAALPPNRGDLTVAEFAENVNFYRGYFDYGQRWTLDSSGGWVENEYEYENENVSYFGGGGAPAPFTYTVEDGVLRAVHWAYSETEEMLFSARDGQCAHGLSRASPRRRRGRTFSTSAVVIAQIDADRWTPDTPCSAAWKNVEMRYDAQVDGAFCCIDGYFFSTQDGQPITVTLTFDARLAE